MINLFKFYSSKKKVDAELNRSSLLYFAAVQEIANKYQVHIVTGHMSDLWQIGEKWGKVGRL